MTENGPEAVWLIGALVLAVSALTARRLSFGAILRSLLGWMVIGAAVWLVLAHRAELEGVTSEVADRLGIGTQTVSGKTVRIEMSPDGHFWARASINGVPKRLLIDSGATITALSPDTASAAGIAVSETGFPTVLKTANGTITAARGSIDSLRVGSLETTDLGVVVSPAFGGVDVLGMNFLSRLGSWRVEGRVLILEGNKRRNLT